jgi:hypothetical protein
VGSKITQSFPLFTNSFPNFYSVADVIHPDIAVLLGDFVALLVGLGGVLDVPGEGTLPVLRDG